MAVRPQLRSGTAIVTRRKNELWYRRRLKLVAEDARQVLVADLRSYLETLSNAQTELYTPDRLVVTRELAKYIDNARKRFRMPFDAERTAEHAAQINLHATDEWWTRQLRSVVEVSPARLPQPQISDAAPTRRRAPAAQRVPRRRVRLAVQPAVLHPLAPLAIIRGQAQIEAAFAEAVRTNVELISSIPVQYYDRMQEVLFAHVETAERWEVLVDRLRDGIDQVNNLADYRVELIARDQSAKMAAAFNEARSTAVGIDEYTWQTAGDERVRETHAANDGQIFRFDSPPEATGNPGDDVNCRCAALPYVEEAQFEEVA